MPAQKETNNQQKQQGFILAGFSLILLFFVLGTAWYFEGVSNSLAFQPPPPTATTTTIFTPIPTFTPTPLPSKPSATPAPPTATNTRVIPLEVNTQATQQIKQTATIQAGPEATQVAQQLQNLAPIHIKPKLNNQTTIATFNPATRLVLAHYFAWFDGHGWDSCNISNGDKPLELYHSDDAAAIARHVQLAQQIGLNGFTLHWFAPGDRTDRNFSSLLTQSQGTNFASTVVFSHHIWHGWPHDISGALTYIINQHSAHPNFLRHQGKPVIFFTDVYRAPAANGQTPQQYWAAIRQQVDPQRQVIWIAEGLDPSYLDAFDGLYVFKITHAAYPHDYQKSAYWGDRVRQWANKSGQSKLWIATITPGWDDRRADCKPDVRIDNTAHRLERANGSIYKATFNAALKSNPDWLIVGSFNEWIEGTYIEPSLQYGDKYMQMTEDFVRRFQE